MIVLFRGVLNMVVKWDSSMSVGEKTIDQQHQQLLTEVNNLVGVISSSDLNMGDLRKSLHFLHGYIQEHFTYEESYMESNGYPGLEKHKKIHQSFVKFYDDFQEELREKCNVKDFSLTDVKKLLEKIEKYLTDWLIKHIKGEDQKYFKYIKAHSK
jgi:hemerythrin